jgi:hypothetical protein
VPKPVDEWVKVPPIGTFKNDWHQANHSSCEYTVRLEYGDVVAEHYGYPEVTGPVPPFLTENRISVGQGHISTVKVADGWLIGTDAGEWGGELRWFSDDGKNSYYIETDPVHKFPTNNVRFFLEAKKDIFVVQGLSHMGIAQGTLSLVSKSPGEGKWSIRTIADLGAGPSAGVVDAEGNFLIVAGMRVVKVTPTGKISVVVEEGAWWSLFPNSAALKSDVLYIGMRQRVARISSISATPVVEYFVPSEKHVLRPPKDDTAGR